MTADTISIFCIVAHVDGFYRNLDFDLHACSLDLLPLCIHQDAVSIDGRSRIQLRHITGILAACKFHRIMFRQLALENILVGIGQNYMDAVRLQTHTNGIALFCTSGALDHNLVIS